MSTTKFNTHLTENYQLKAADELISKLRIELGAANSYIEELESKITILEEKNKKLEEINKKLNNKYSDDVKQFLRTDLLYQKYARHIDKVISDYKEMKKKNEKLVAEIIKLRNEGNN